MTATKIKTVLFTLLAAILIAAPLATPAQDQGGTTTAPGTGSTIFSGDTQKGVVELSDLFEKAEQTRSRVSSLVASTDVEVPGLPEEGQLKRDIEDSEDSVEELFAKNVLLPVDVEARTSRWQRQLKDLDGLTETLGQRISSVETARNRIREELILWNSTRDSYTDRGITGAPVERAQELIDYLKQAEQTLAERMTPLLSAQEELASRKAMIREHLAFLRDTRSGIAKKLWQRDRTSLLSGDFSGRLSTVEPGSLVDRWSDQAIDLTDYLRARAPVLVFGLVALLALWLWLRTLLPGVRERYESLPNTDESMALFGHPFAIAVLLMVIVMPAFHVDAPILAKMAYWAVLPVPAAIVLYVLIQEKHIKLFIIGMAISYYIGLSRDLLLTAPPLDRISLILQALVGLTVTAVFVNPDKFDEQSDYSWGRWGSWLKTGKWLLMALFATVLLGQVLGYNRLSALIGQGTFRTVYVSLFMVATYRLLRSLWTYVVFTPSMSRIRVVKNHVLDLIAWAWRWLAVASVLLWAYLVLGVWGVLGYTEEYLATFWDTGFTVGETKISIGIMVTAIIALLVSVKLSRVISYVLEEDIYPRRKVSKGLGSAINQGIRYIIVFIGFIVALALLGMNLQSLAIVAGALGVGIGFGLQNVVNNFVSGIIMLVERPIKIGDVLEFDNIWGNVRHIGIRATIIETWDRSELIVPNGDLLWARVTNWTHTTGLNRVIVGIGVAYGSDVEKVMEILKEVADNHQEVSRDPEPVVLFMGFGDSSLDFEIRCYLPSVDMRLKVASELRVAVYRALAENDITIPFPQRDVWIRSIEDKLVIKGAEKNKGPEDESSPPSGVS